ncbi:4637_t:CDS:2, partial [Paraglomus occultum]
THVGTMRTPKQSEFPKELKDDLASDEKNKSRRRESHNEQSSTLTSAVSNESEITVSEPDATTVVRDGSPETFSNNELPEIVTESTTTLPDDPTPQSSTADTTSGQVVRKKKFYMRDLSKNSLTSSSPNLRNGLGENQFKSPSMTDLRESNPLFKRNYLASLSKQRPQSAMYSHESTDDENDRENKLYRQPPETSDNSHLDDLDYDVDRKRRLLKGNYFHSEIQFLIALQDISTRLIIVPREARQSTLRAELTLLNHNLPAEICIPLWCPATTESPQHHRVVRISPTDAVVLNSADRVPYLVLVEVLEEDMGFGSSEAQSKKAHRWSTDNKQQSRSVDDKSTDQPPTQDFLSKPLDSQSATPVSHSLESMSSTLADSTSMISTSRSSSPNNPGQNRVVSSSLSSKRSASVEKLTRISTASSYSDSPPSHTILSIPETSSPSSELTPSPSAPLTPGSAYPQEILSRRHSRVADEYAERMRTAAVMLAQLSAAQQGRSNSTGPGTASVVQRSKADTEAIKQNIVKQMQLLEEQRMKKMTTMGVNVGMGWGEILEDEKKILSSINQEDPSAAVFRENWKTKKDRIRKSSPYGHHPNWRLLSLIVKTGADLRQEQLACQLIKEMQRIWREENVNVWVKYYRVLVTSDNSGLIETIQNSISIHSIKKDAYAKRLNEKGFMFTLFDYFVKTYGDVTSVAFLEAQDNFMRSLAAYSLVCYILQVKDRHNGNLLLDTDGHLIHIDFGFMLSNSPGSVGFELAPFKLSQEYLDILGGVTSEKFAEFKSLVKQAFIAVRKHADNIILLVEMMQKDSKLPCFASGEGTAAQLRDRFQLTLTEPQFEEFLERLIMSSCCNMFTRLYDTFQYYSNGIL